MKHVVVRQIRESIEDTEFRFLRTGLVSGSIVLRSVDDGHYELWTENDHYAGYVIVFQCVGYEYCTRMTEIEVLALP